VKWRSCYLAIARQAIETKAHLKGACYQIQKVCFQAWLSAILSEGFDLAQKIHLFNLIRPSAKPKVGSLTLESFVNWNI
jgi:hypothetical protein